MVVDKLYAVYLTFQELLAELTGYVDALRHIGLVGKLREVAGTLQSHLLYLLSNFSAHWIDKDVLLAECRIFFHCGMEHFRHIGVEAAAEAAVRGIDNECHMLYRTNLTENGVSISLACKE